MKSNLLTLTFLLITALAFSQPCTVNDASGCVCEDGSTDCYLLPNIKLSYDLLIDPDANPEEAGELRVSVSTPNVGHGPLRVIATNSFVCGTDTIFNQEITTCPDGSTPKQLVKQRIYKKEGNTMTYEDRWAGSMTYHPTHNHSHFDDWGVYSLRIEDPNEPDPLNWPIVGEGAKLGFCLMDYGSCDYYNGQCRDDNNNILTTDAPNYGLGGGEYSCGLTNQGISAGWTDIYYYYLDGMFITIPEGVCNGDYMLVVEVDPHNVLLEENDDDNLMVAPITLTEQTASASDVGITASGPLEFCSGESVELSVPAIGSQYQWSNGATTSSIMVTESGTYSCVVTTPCGEATAQSVTVTVNNIDMPVSSDVNIMEGEQATLTASGAGTLRWYNAMTGGSILGTGATYTTPALYTNTTYYVESYVLTPGGIEFAGAPEHTGNSQYSGSQYNGQIIFDALSEFTLKTVKVYTNTPGIRIIQLRDNANNLLLSRSIDVVNGESRIELDFDIMPGSGYVLTTDENNNNTLYGDLSPVLQRSSNGVSYPYILQDVVQLNDSNYGTEYYYYFYDWEIQLTDTECVSEREAVNVNVEPVSNEDISFVNGLSVMPNPNNGVFNLEFSMQGNHETNYGIYDVTGRLVHNKDLGTFSGVYTERVEVAKLAAGVYYLELTADGQTMHRKLIISK